MNDTTSDECPAPIRTWSVDEVAECLPGITGATYVALWKLIERGENRKPPGGDGSDGTVEEPVVSENFSNGIKACWPLLTDAQRQNIRDAVMQDFDEEDDDDDE